MRTCRTCKAEKDESEFYKHLGSKGGISTECKECAKVAQKRVYRPRKNHRDIISGRDTENKVIAQLNFQGIYAVSGKATQFRWCDVVAWGCVTIEVKTSKLNKRGMYQFAFTPMQRKRGIVADLVLLVCEDQNTFHLFPSNHAVFYHSDGTLKAGMGYMPNCESPKVRKDYESLTDKTMQYYQDAWAQIETKRLNMVKKLCNSTH